MGARNTRKIRSSLIQVPRLDLDQLRGLLFPIALGNTILALQVITLLNYSRLDPVASLSWFAWDSHCDTDSGEGWGVHCFGDYAFVRNAIESGNPWSSSYRLNYTPSALGFTALAYGVEHLTGVYNAGLFFYLFLMLICLSTPWFFLVALDRRLAITEKFLALGVLGPLAVPALIALDRGNSIAFAVPGIFLFSWGVLQQNPKITALGIVLASIIKLQFAGLVLFLLLKRKWRHAIGTTVGFFALNLMSALAFPVGLNEVLAGVFRALSSFGGEFSIENTHPQIVSLAKGIYFLSFGTASHTIATITSLLLAMVSIVAIFFLRRLLSDRELAIILVILVAITNTVTFSYYLVVFQVVAFLALSAEKTARNDETGDRVSFVARWQKKSQTVLLIVSLSAVLFPIFTGPYGTLWTTMELTPVVAIIVISLTLLRAIQRRKSNTSVEPNEAL